MNISQTISISITFVDGSMVIWLFLWVKAYRCLYEAWRQLMRTRFQIQDGENGQVLGLTKCSDAADFTGKD